LFPEAELFPEQAAAPLDVAVSVDFRGPLAGRLVVRASRCILPAIAANMLGADESRDEDEPAARVEFGVEDGRVETRLYLFPATAAAA
jgi:hypothetical protein